MSLGVALWLLGTELLLRAFDASLVLQRPAVRRSTRLDRLSRDVERAWFVNHGAPFAYAKARKAYKQSERSAMR